MAGSALSCGLAAHCRESGMQKACARLLETILQAAPLLKEKTLAAV